MRKHIKNIINSTAADSIEARYTDTYGSAVVISKGEVEKAVNTSGSAGSIRIAHAGALGFCAFNDGNWSGAVERALESCQVAGNQKTFLADTSVISDDVENQILEDPDNLTLEEKYRFTRNVHDLLWDEAFDSTRVEFKNYTVEKLYINSQGSDILQKKHFTGMSVSAAIKEGQTLQRAYFSEGAYGGMEVVKNCEEKIEAVKKRVRDLVKAPKIESGTYRVLLNPNLAGVFAHEAFGHMSEADFLADNPELLKKIKLGTVLGAEELTIVDDGRQSHLAGWCPYDDEGVPAARRELLKNGRVSCYLQSRLTAKEMNTVPTGNGRALSPFYSPIPRMTNTYIENGSRSFGELLEQLWDGIYACDMTGGMTNLEMFTFSAAYAYKVEKGKITGLIRDVVLSGNLFTTMKNIIGIGSDLEHHGGLGGCGKAGQNGLPVSTGSPHLLIDNVLIG